MGIIKHKGCAMSLSWLNQTLFIFKIFFDIVGVRDIYHCNLHRNVKYGNSIWSWMPKMIYLVCTLGFAQFHSLWGLRGCSKHDIGLHCLLPPLSELKLRFSSFHRFFYIWFKLFMSFLALPCHSIRQPSLSFIGH